MGNPLPETVADQVFRNARTFNGYVDRPVPADTLHALYDIYKWGPTSTNQQPQRIIWCTTDEAKRQLASHCFAGNVEKVLKAPVTAILGMERDFISTLPRLFPHTDARGWYGTDERFIADSALRNATLQAAYLIMAVRMLGLDAGPLGGFNEDGINAAFFPNSTVRVNFLLTLGYGDASTLFPRSPRLDFDEANKIV